MAESPPRAKRHSDYVQVMTLRTPAPTSGVPSLRTYAEEHLRIDLSEPEPDGYIRISKKEAEGLLQEIDHYVESFGPLVEVDRTLVAELQALLAAWENQGDGERDDVRGRS